MLSKISKGLTNAQRTAAVANSMSRAFSSGSTKDNEIISKQQKEGDFGITPKEQHLQFSKAPIMSNFGELPFGEIPEPLKYTRPFQMTTLSNGIRVCTEKVNRPIVTAGVYVQAGSRDEDLETSGVSYILHQLMQKGTTSRSGSELKKELSLMGTKLEQSQGREISSFTLKLFKDDLQKGVKILGDIVCNSKLDSSDLELVKEATSQEHEKNYKNYFETTMENVHFNIFREHMMGQPVKGDRDNVHNISQDHVREFHKANYYGDNMLVVAVGDINHEEFVNTVNNSFQGLQKSTNIKQKNSEKPIYIPALLYIRDDEMYNSNVGVFYDAPSATHPDVYAFNLLKYIFGTYRVDKNAEHLNDVHKQYSSQHALLGDLVDVTRSECVYKPYSDAGIWGNYFFGNEVFTRQMNYCGVCMPTIYAHYMNDVEVYRGRNALFDNLLNNESTEYIAHVIAQQIFYQGRRTSRSEFAKRIANMDNYHLKNLANQWFYDAEPSFTNWGPIESVSQVGSYKYFKIHTLSTITNAHHALFV